MKKIIFSITTLLVLTSSSVNMYKEEWVTIYCRADLEKCVHNLTQLKSWLQSDHKSGKISSKIYDEYFVALDNTTRGLQMLIKDEGQCDTTDYKIKKLKYSK